MTSYRKRIALVLLGLFSLFMLSYIAVLMRAQGYWGGHALEATPLATLQFPEQVESDLDCNGVHKTPLGTWLISTDNSTLSASATEMTAGTAPIDLSSMLPPIDDRAWPSNAWTTYISRVNDQGTLQLVATVNGTACMLTSTDGTRIMLMTSLKRHSDETSPGSEQQTAVFRSIDQGKTWHVVEEGFFPQADRQADKLVPTRWGDALWQWSSLLDATFEAITAEVLSAASLDEPMDQPLRVSLYYSPDFGKTTSQVNLPPDLMVTDSMAHQRIPAGAKPASHGHDDTKVYAIQASADRAYVWVSQRFPYSYPSDIYVSGSIRFTSSVVLERRDGIWVAGALQRDEGAFLNIVTVNAQGHVFATVIDSDDRTDFEKLKVFDEHHRAWRTISSLPNPFAPMLAWRSAATLYAGEHSIVLGLRAGHYAPRPASLRSDGPALVMGGGDYVSTDGGKSWTLIKTGAIVGFDPTSDRLYTVDAAKFRSHELRPRGSKLMDQHR